MGFMDSAFESINPVGVAIVVFVSPLLLLFAYRAIHHFPSLHWLTALLPVSYKDTNAVVSGLYIYPVKSCRGHPVEEAEITELGFKYDRRWMVIDEENNFVTQRQNPRLALLVPTIKEDNGKIVLSFQGDGPKASVSPIIVPLKRLTDVPSENLRTVRVWGTAVQYAVDQGEEVAEWLAKFLEQPDVRLVFFDETKSQRSVPPSYRTPSWKSPNAVGFADGFPYLMISEESLEELNSRLEDKLPMNRFRPNIVIKNCPPFFEDRLRDFKLGDTVFYGVKKCSRCRITTTNQDTAEQGTMNSEPLKTLKTYRSPTRNKILFGVNLIAGVRDNQVVLKVGEPVKAGVIGRIPPFFSQEESAFKAVFLGKQQ